MKILDPPLDDLYKLTPSHQLTPVYGKINDCDDDAFIFIMLQIGTITASHLIVILAVFINDERALTKLSCKSTGFSPLTSLH